MSNKLDNSKETALGAAEGNVGLIVQPRAQNISPSIAAEQQRARSEIEAMLTIAAARPRDESKAFDAIIIACQRPGLAETSQYSYSRGGTAIFGPSIELMEVIAQKWGNLSYGFRELMRHVGSGSTVGESVVEAYAWDLETNTRRQTQFFVTHAEKTKRGLRTVTDERDIYEFVANRAQRRVRTCLENLIPRDITEAARLECDKTLKASIEDVPKAAAEMLKAFAKFDVTKDMFEKRIQRHIDAITPAQIVGLRKIYASLRDGMSQPSDWFDVSDGTNKPVMDTAKDALRKRSKGKAAKPAEPVETPAPDVAPSNEAIMQRDEYMSEIAKCETAGMCESLRHQAEGDSVLTPAMRETFGAVIDKRIAELRKGGDA